MRSRRNWKVGCRTGEHGDRIDKITIMKILIVGATGALGRHVTPRLIERGHHVRAIVRSKTHDASLREMGAEPVMGDIFDKVSLQEAAQGCEVAIHIATAIPKSGSVDWSLNDRVRREGTRNLLEIAGDQGMKRYIQQSVTLLYGDHGQTIVDESAPFKPSEIVQSASDMEELVRASALDWCILRGGLFYGADTGREDGWRKSAQQGRLTIPGDGSDLLSLIHVVDMARAVVAAAEEAPPKSLYNIVDDHPVSYREVFNYVCAQLNVSPPQPGGAKFLPSLGCSNVKVRRELEWAPLYPSYRSGLA